ncbi:MAG: hypothetical protein ACR2P6_06670, partial [Gammaproteobacteria bacterium]
SARQIPDQAANTYKSYFHHMLDAGIYLAPSSFEIGFLSTAHTSDDINQLVAGTRSFLRS